MMVPSEKYGADAAPSIDETVAPEESLYLATAHNLETMEREAASLKKRDDFQVFVAYGNYERVRTLLEAGLSDVDMRDYVSKQEFGLSCLLSY
jgi:hypothetical protein